MVTSEEALRWLFEAAFVAVTILATVGWFERRCTYCHGRGTYWAGEIFADGYEAWQMLDCPGCTGARL